MENQQVSELFSVNKTPKATPRRIRRTPKGYLVGESHHRAKLTDAEVISMREIHLQKKAGYKKLAVQFGVGISTARDICTFRTRPIL